MNWPQAAFELLKLVLQLAGAIFVARKTVVWALGRYKSEKLWERQLAAYSDLITALSVMHRVIDNWIDEWEYNSKGDTDVQQAEYNEARKTVRQFASLGRIILPRDVSQQLYRFEIEFDAAASGNFAEPTEYLYPQKGLVNQLIETLVIRGRADTGNDPMVKIGH